MLLYLVVGFTLVGIITHTVLSSLQIKDRRYDGNRLRVVLNGVYAAGIVLWPLLFHALVDLNSIGNTTHGITNFLMTIGFMWPVVLIAVDMLCVCKRKKANAQESLSREGEIRGNANVLIGAAWALGALLSVVKGSEGDYPQSREGARIILIALLLCLAFVIPTSDHPTRSYDTSMIRAGQKTILNFSIGLFVTGIAVSWAK